MGARFSEVCVSQAACLPSMQASMNQLMGTLQKARVSPTARLAILGSMFELFELKVRLHRTWVFA
eukprot:scaffold134960_cov14-Tisochrysis_lutea.AAC.2